MLMNEGKAVEERAMFKFGEVFRVWVCKIGGSLVKACLQLPSLRTMHYGGAVQLRSELERQPRVKRPSG